MTELDMMAIQGSTSGTDEMDTSELANLPIEKLAGKPVEMLTQLPTELLAKLLAEMASEKGARLLSELPVSQAMDVLAAFSGEGITRVLADFAGKGIAEAIEGDESEDALDGDREDEDDFDSDDDEDEDFEDEDEDDDSGDDDEEDDSEDEDEETSSTQHRKGSSAPVGKRVIQRSDYKSNVAYCEAVVKSMHAVLHKLGIHTEIRNIRPNVKAFAFDKTTRGVDIDCHILCEYDRCNYRIEFKFNVDNQPGRTPIIDYFCQDKNFPLRYGCLIMDHQDGEKKLEYSSCFYGAFSEEAFATYFDLLGSTLKVYAADYAKIAGEKKLDTDQRKVVKSMLGDLCTCLPARVKPENEEKLTAVTETLGGHLKPSQKKLLNYIVEHIK